MSKYQFSIYVTIQSAKLMDCYESGYGYSCGPFGGDQTTHKALGDSSATPNGQKEVVETTSKCLKGGQTTPDWL